MLWILSALWAATMLEQAPPSADDDAALRLALAVADGTPVNWAEASITVSEGDASGALGLALQRVERIIEGHRSLYARSPALGDSGTDILLTGARRAAEPDVHDDVQVSWGPLVVRDKIGRGSFSDVYRAWDPNLEREVALKLVPATTTTGSVSAAFEEGRLLARVRHPNVVTIYGVEKVQGRVGIWMEFVPGPTLADEVESRGTLSLDDAAQVGLEVCLALGAVHDAGLLHRDVKAQNVMRDENGRVLLGDFGTGIRSAEHASAEVVVAGTPLYLAPEACRGERPTGRSDLYSVGVLLYFLVTGRHPVSGRTFKDVRDAHAAGRRTPLREARPELPNNFVTLVERLLDPNPERRPATAADVERLLTDWLKRDVHATVGDAAVGVEPRQIPTSTLWLAVAATAGLAAAAVTVWTMQNRTETTGGSERPTTAAGFALTGVTRQLADAPCWGARSVEIRHRRLADDSDRSLAFLPPDASTLELGQWVASDGLT